MEVAIGALVLLVGATGATVATQRLPAMGYGRFVPLALVASGALIGAGAALARGWDLVGTTLAGAVVVPLLAIAVRLLETRADGGSR